MRTPLLAALIAALPAAAQAHIVFDVPQAQAGGYYTGFLRVTHGCGASPTRSVRVEIPAGIDMARPQPKPGWTLAIEHQPLPKPVPTEGGGTLTERVSAITWTGSLPADEFDQFGISVKLPTTPGPLFFKTVQSCVAGANNWVHLPATPAQWHATPEPAPMLILTAPDAMPGMAMPMPMHH